MVTYYGRLYCLKKGKLCCVCHVSVWRREGTARPLDHNSHTQIGCYSYFVVYLVSHLVPQGSVRNSVLTVGEAG